MKPSGTTRTTRPARTNGAGRSDLRAGDSGSRRDAGRDSHDWARGRVLLRLAVANLCGGERFSAADVAGLRARIEELVPGILQPIIATGHSRSLLEAALGWPGARLTWRPGPDGADHALVDIATTEQVAERYHQIVIGSGDHAFASLARQLREVGVHVTALAGLGLVSAELYTAVDDVRTVKPGHKAAAA